MATSSGPPASFTDDPRKLKERFTAKRDAMADDLDEAECVLGLFYSRPDRADVLDAKIKGDYTFWKAEAFNLMQEAASAVKSEVCKPLEVKMVPVGANFEQLMSAQVFNQAVNSNMDEQEFLDKLSIAFLDSELCGRGYCIEEPDLDGNLTYSRLCPLNTFYNKSLTRVMGRRFMDRRLVEATFGDTPEKVEAIKGAPCARPEYIARVDALKLEDEDDQIAVYFGYAAPLGKLEGRFVVQLDHQDVVLRDVPWDMDVPVFSVTYDTGFREGEARSLGRIIAPYATQLKSLAKTHREQLAGNKTVVVHRPGVVFSPSNETWQHVEVPEGADEPVIKTMSSVAPESKDGLTLYHDAGLREAGINSGMAAGEPPPQFKSGLALQEWRKSLLSRLSQPQRQFEKAWIWAMRIAAQYFPRLYKNKKVRVKAQNTALYELVDFNGLDIKEKEANWTFQVVSGLGLTDSGKLEVFGTFQEAGVIDALDVLGQMSTPDLEAVKKQVLGHRNLIEKQISQARDYNKLIAPVDGQDYKFAATRASNAYAAAIVDGIYPKANLEKLRVLYHLFLARANKTPPPIVQPGVPANDNAAAAGAAAPAPAGDLANAGPEPAIATA